DQDGDSTMHSSPGSSGANDAASDDLFPGADDVLPPTSGNIANTGASILSPPDSQGAAARAATAAATAAATGSPRGAATADADATINANGKRVHAPSGYAWSREADAPGWAWLNKKAQDEWAKAEEGLVEKDRAVRGRYGDPFD
ncbi:uncharacterized protein K452DRAFT_201981, partial [Aplosporella prunicola CBS 121167]